IFQLINSTVSGNVANTTGGAIDVFANVNALIYNSTIVGNSANVSTSRNGGVRLNNGATNPPGASNATQPTLSLVSTIVANNTVVDIAPATPNSALTLPLVIITNNSLVRTPCSAANCTLAGSANVLSQDPLLASLA